jgi:porphobilinogen synthase
VILFGVRPQGRRGRAWDPDGIVRSLRDLRDDVGDDSLIADLCVDEYTDHGHCGVLDDGAGRQRRHPRPLRPRGRPAEAGADITAPSGMMDGQVLAIREALDDDGFESVAILAYAAKYASALYGPFRDAVDVTIVGGGDRKGYQQDYRNAREAMEEIRFDVGEGADMIMVKPALAYLDIIARARAELDLPLAAYHVSGEYAMIQAAAERGWIDGPAVALEHLTAVKRAGADLILTYFARDLAEALDS